MSKWKKYAAIVALGFAGGTIYLLPYIRYTFYDAQIAAQGITNTQSSLMLTVYTIVNMIMYIPGGILADKFKPKKAIAISLVATGLLSFLYAMTLPSFAMSLIIWAGLSFSTAFVFWSALMKAVGLVGDEDQQGFLYGLYYAFNGLSAAIGGAIALAAYNSAGDDLVAAFSRAVNTEGVIVIVVAIAVWFFLDESKMEVKVTREEDKFSFKHAVVLLKNPILWIFSFVVLVGYGFYSNVSYFTPYLTEIQGIPESSAAAFALIRTYVFLLLAPVGGLIADKLCHSTTKWLTIAYLIIALTFIGVMALPSTTSPTAASIYTLLPGAVAMMAYGVVFSTLSETGISPAMRGTAIGLASIIGYLPDTVYSMIFGHWLDNMEAAAAYRTIFIFLAASGVIGAILTMYINRKNKQRLEAEAAMADPDAMVE